MMNRSLAATPSSLSLRAGGALLVAVLLLSAGGAGMGGLTAAGQASLAQEPDKPSRRWKRVASQHFEVIGDASERELRDALKELEIFRLAITRLSPSWQFSSPAPTMIMFQDGIAFSPFKPRDSEGRRRNNIAGYYQRLPEGARMVMAAGYSGRLRNDQFKVVLHEYTHDLLHLNLPPLPLWLQEGLADYHGSIAGTSSDSTRYLGRPLDMHLLSLRGGDLIPVKDLINPASARRAMASPSSMSKFYAESWALVHYLLLGRDTRKPGQITAYLNDLQRGRQEGDAFEAAFGVTADAIDRELRQYVQSPRFRAVTIDVPPDIGKSMTTSSSPLLESEVDLTLGSLYLSMDVDEDAAKALSRAAARNPTSLAIKLQNAKLLLRQDRAAEAVDLLKGVVAMEPASFAGLYFLGVGLFETGDYSGSLRALKTAASIDPEYGGLLSHLSAAALAAGEANDAERAMAELQQSVPQDAHFSRALLLWRAGQYADVLRDVQSHVALLNDAVPQTAYPRFLGALSARRLGHTGEASALLAELEPSSAVAPWPKAVLAFLQGRLAADAFLRQAKSQGERTEAHAYIGVAASVDQQTDLALTHLRWVKEHGLKTFTEYGMATSELRRLETSQRASSATTP